MKVYIGPYSDGLSAYVYRLVGLLKHIGVSEDKIYEIEDKIPLKPFRWIDKTFGLGERKVEVRIDRYDTWNMDNTLAHIIHPMLVQLKETKHGSPWVDDEDVPEHLRSTAASPKENEWDTDENHAKRWEWVLDEMIYTFACEIDGTWEDKFHTGEIDIEWIKSEDGGSFEMIKGPNDTHVFNREAYDEAWARRHNGLRLFAKYYHGLWD